MCLIAQQPYVKVERQVNSTEQIDIERERTIYLYDNRVVTKHREFPIQDVFDMSFRQVAGKGGILYLHTSQGVFSYTVKSSPTNFIQLFKDHIKKF